MNLYRASEEVTMRKVENQEEDPEEQEEQEEEEVEVKLTQEASIEDDCIKGLRE